MLQTSDGANDLCYNPHWPDTPDVNYEGRLVNSCGKEGPGPNPPTEGTIWPNCEAAIYLVIDGMRRLVPNKESFLHLWPSSYDNTIRKPADAFHDLPVGKPLCNMTPLFKSDKKGADAVYLMVEGKKRHIINGHTIKHLRFKDGAVQTMPNCAVDAIPDGVPINYENLEGDTDKEHHGEEH